MVNKLALAAMTNIAEKNDYWRTRGGTVTHLDASAERLLRKAMGHTYGKAPGILEKPRLSRNAASGAAGAILTLDELAKRRR